jgi:hypothetical protein
LDFADFAVEVDPAVTGEDGGEQFFHCGGIGD